MNPILALIIANIIWGGASPIFKFALKNIPPFTLAFIRFFTASFLFMPFLKKYWPKKLLKKQWLEIFLVGFFGIFINVSFFFLGVRKTESINVPIIASAGPVFLYFFSIIFLRERPRFKVLFGMIVSFLGVLIIVFSPFFSNKKTIEFGQFEGNLLIVLATFGSVMATVFGKKILSKVNPYVLTFFSFLFSSILFLLFVPLELKNWSFSQLNVNGWVGIVYGIFFSSALAYFCYYYGISKIPAQEVGVFAYIDPVVAVVLAIPLLGEVPDVYFLVGSVLVFLGIFLAERRIHWHPFKRIKNQIY